MVNLFVEFGIADTGVPDDALLAAVEMCDVEKMRELLEGTASSQILSKGVDEFGRQLLHLASCCGGQDAAADMVRLLLEHDAPVNAADFSGETPLSLAITAFFESSDSSSADSWAALDTIRVLLVAGATDLSSSVLRGLEENQNEENEELRRLLQAFGIGVGEAGAVGSESESVESVERSDLEQFHQKCQEESIPLDKLSSLGAKAVLASCCQWREMNVKQLRAECSEVGIPTDVCVEKAEVIEHFGRLVHIMATVFNSAQYMVYFYIM